MRYILAVVAALMLTGCSSSDNRLGCGSGPPPGMEQSWRMSCDPAVADAGKNWCQRNPIACLPIAIPAAVAVGLIQEAPGAAVNAVGNSSFYSDRVTTPNGTYSVDSFCSGTNCDTTIKKR